MHNSLLGRFVSSVVLSSSLVPALAAAQSGAVDRAVNTISQDYEDAADEAIQSFCADRWPTDYEMQNDCYETQVDARNKSQAYDLIGGSKELMIIWAKCSQDWTDSQERVDWEMQYDCTQSQLAALEKIKRRRK